MSLDSFDEPVESNEGLIVTFNPPLYLQRQMWLLNALTREKVRSVLDIGCGEGNLLHCLTEPSISVLPPEKFQVLDELYIDTVHGLDPSLKDLQYTLQRIAPNHPNSSSNSSNHHYDSVTTKWDDSDLGDSWAPAQQPRWTPLKVSLWNGGFENLHYDMFGADKVDAFIATEVIEHLTVDNFPSFAPVLLGHYRPRLILLTTPNYTYNQRFHPPDEPSLTGYPDPTGRTQRVFRHHDHKFEWTTEEWESYCIENAKEYGYQVEVGGIGKAIEPDPWSRESVIGFATLTAIFRRIDHQIIEQSSVLSRLSQSPKPTLLATHIHQPHPLSLEELSIPPNPVHIYKAVQDALIDNRCRSSSLRELWKTREVVLKCKGDVKYLAQAFEVGNFDAEEWNIRDATENGWEIEVTWNQFELPPEVETHSSPTLESTEDEDMMMVFEDTNDDITLDWFPSEKDGIGTSNIGEGWGWGVPIETFNWGEAN
ncbi:hypothetical protein Clacol_002459 [Clathrus columnatus]|uniref:Small RNA 2'-O-methyltransferase n=1 Tax=Clathrus columnatus TaxID=1419009 RepID=A0AAV5A0X0_9AGAM|nr:hypothetical protein Clacol_002459 [Clathrus columnatus]